MRYITYSLSSPQKTLLLANTNKLQRRSSTVILEKQYSWRRWKSSDVQHERAQEVGLPSIPNDMNSRRAQKADGAQITTPIILEELTLAVDRFHTLKKTLKHSSATSSAAHNATVNDSPRTSPPQRTASTSASRSMNVPDFPSGINATRRPRYDFGKIRCADPELEKLLHESLKVYALPAHVYHDRLATLGRVQAMITKSYSIRYRVALFGSTLYGVSTPDSDLDMVILDPNRPTGKQTQKVAPIYAIRNLAKNFQRAGFRRIVAIPKAKVPIVKFYDPITNLNGDINPNERFGLYNSRMIKQYCNHQPLLRPMLAFIKSWAKPRGLNKPGISDGPPTFSSYAFAVMTIAYLQSINLVPNLQAIDESLIDPTLVFHRKNKACSTQFRYIRHGEWLPPAELSLQEALYGWFKFWGTEYPYHSGLEGFRIDIKAGFHFLPSTSTSSGVHRDSVPRKKKGPKIRLMDPFTNENITKMVPMSATERFRVECQRTADLLVPPHPPSAAARHDDSSHKIVHMDVNAKIAHLRALTAP
ncbi:hypothetical protein F5878DRAFT_257420 [Lentinula raphanica]|uniref:Poly(A) RNA polymerase mitochondrial-like central palm domain-containing protein n=1 Tax=Lentinula raphanica TaxID=153919 RepID=A0AA38UJ30_9AGAR|nr:hypothetical protein F5878DRAFT_257420 [Lentinula raphanica]